MKLPQIPLRNDEERLSFCDKYFATVGAAQTYAADMYREYRLPLDVDKELTDRPFFWLWAEKTQQTVEPTTLRLAFSETAKTREDERLAAAYQAELAKRPPQNPYERMFAKPPQAEWVNFGSLRMEKICDSAVKRGEFAAVIPARDTSAAVYIPWLLVNGLIQFTADSIQDEWFSIGVCLANKQTITGFYDRLKQIPMQNCDPQLLLRQAKHTPQEALKIVQTALQNDIETRPHTWAQEAALRLADDLAQLDTYYKSILSDYPEDEQDLVMAEHRRKRRDLLDKSQPHVDIQCTQFALVGLPLRQTAPH